MNLLLEMLMPALILSCLAGCALILAAKAPPRVRFWIAVTGLFAWVVPWPLMSRAFASTESSMSIPLIGIPANGIASVTARIADRLPEHDAGLTAILGKAPDYWLIGLFVPGLLWFVYDYLFYRRTLLRWRQISQPNESLRDLLPIPLRSLKTSIHIVKGSRVAAASGILKPALWIGDQFTDEGLRTALTHESCHIFRRDPLRVMLIAVIRRAYFWNPIVAFFARQAGFFLEAACDSDCATLLGREQYRNELAQLILRAHESPELPRIVPAVLTRGDNLLRVRLLETKARKGLTMYGALILCAVGVFLAVTLALHAQDDGELHASFIRRGNFIHDGSRVMRDLYDEKEEQLQRVQFWEKVGDYILVRKGLKLYYIDDAATAQRAFAAFKDMRDHAAPIERRVYEQAKAERPDLQEKVQELSRQNAEIIRRLDSVPGGLGYQDEKLLAEGERLANQILRIQGEMAAKVWLQHPDWKTEREKLYATWPPKLQAIATEGFEKGLAHPMP